MKLRYAIRPNPLTADPEDCTARIVSTGTITFEQFVDRVAEQNTTVSHSDVQAVFEDGNALAIKLLRDGYIVDTGLVILFLAVQGHFKGPLDLFDPARHKVVVRYRTARRLRRAARHFTSLERVLERDPAPMLQMFVDANSETHDERITPGGIAQLWGDRLQFDPADPAQGVFFIAEDLRETKAAVVILNNPRQLFIQVPNLPAGRYRVEVRAVLRHSSQLSCGKLDEQLLVE